MMKRARGFTLTEAAVAIAIVGIVAVAAIGLYAAVMRSFTATRKTTVLVGRAQAAIDYLIHEFRPIGGNGIPASAGIFVEDAAAARGDPVVGFPSGDDLSAPEEGRTGIPGRADRITIFVALPNLPRCPMRDVEGPLTSSGTGVANFPIGPRVPNTCCFTTGTVQPFKRTAMLVRNDYYRPVLITNESGSCQFEWQDIAPPIMRNLPTEGTLGDALNGGYAVLVDFRTIYLDPTTHDIIMHLDKTFTDDTLNGFGDRPSVTGERLRILDGVYDLQVALGYDLDDSGDVTESDDGTGDEWLYNAPGETEGSMGAGFDRRKLRLVRIETIVGIPSLGPSSGNILFSPARTTSAFRIPGVVARPVGTRIAPRNLDVYKNAGGGA
jgi:prepilin-type N-terminal cleavage/methylation domain-containing protein